MSQISKSNFDAGRFLALYHSHCPEIVFNKDDTVTVAMFLMPSRDRQHTYKQVRATANVGWYREAIYNCVKTYCATMLLPLPWDEAMTPTEREEYALKPVPITCWTGQSDE